MTARTTPPIKPVAASVSSRRRAAKKIEALRQREDDLLTAIAMDRGLLARQRENICRLEGILERATRTAGRMSILFPAAPQKVAGPLQRRIRVDVSKPADFYSMSSECLTRETKDLETLIAGVSPDALRRSVHCWAQFNDGNVAYAIDGDDLLMMDPEHAEHMLQKAILPSLARELMKHVRRRR